VPHDDPDFLVALAAYVNRRALQRSAGISGQLRGHEFKVGEQFVVVVLSPMPGLLVEVAVQPGQKVQAGERVAVIEAMKMENVLFAAADGVVGKVLAAKGERWRSISPLWNLHECKGEVCA
jgi:acetyl/propionyl-CoA carboxylase alpha subunit